MSRNLFTGIDRLCSNNLPWQLDEKLRWELSLKLGFPAEDLQYHLMADLLVETFAELEWP